MMQHITKTPGVCGGRACIAGHRIRVTDVVAAHELRRMSAEEIVAELPGINLKDVEAALAYYRDHRQEIEDEFRQDEQWAQWLQANIPSKIPPELRGDAGA